MVGSLASTSTRVREECSAWRRTAFRVQVDTAMSPLKLLISRRAPGRTANVVSVWVAADSAAAVRTAQVANMDFRSFLLALPGGEHGRRAEQVDLALHRRGEVGAQPVVGRIRGHRAARLLDRPIDGAKI